VKAIQTYRIYSLTLGVAVLFGCTVQRDTDIIRADGEIFESVVKTQLPDTVEPALSGKPAFVGFDERPAGDNSTLAKVPAVDLLAAADSDSAGRSTIRIAAAVGPTQPPIQRARKCLAHESRL
jgi:hypothetical protein